MICLPYSDQLTSDSFFAIDITNVNSILHTYYNKESQTTLLPDPSPS